MQCSKLFLILESWSDILELSSPENYSITFIIYSVRCCRLGTTVLRCVDVNSMSRTEGLRHWQKRLPNLVTYHFTPNMIKKAVIFVFVISLLVSALYADSSDEQEGVSPLLHKVSSTKSRPRLKKGQRRRRQGLFVHSHTPQKCHKQYSTTSKVLSYHNTTFYSMLYFF